MSDQTPQIGGSNRGPRQLDEAKKNQGQPPQNDEDESGDEALASGRTEGGEVDAARRGQEKTSPRQPSQPEPITERKKL